MEPKKPNWFVRILIVGLCLFIGWIIYTSFCWSIPTATISTGLIVLVAFLTVLVLSEAFDNFSIGKLLSVGRKLNEKETENKELKRENVELRNQIVNVSSNLTQKQSNANYFFADEVAKMFNIKKADEQEIKQKETDETSETSSTTTTTTTTKRETTGSRYVPFRHFEEYAFKAYSALEGISAYNVIRNAKFGQQFQDIDPISTHSPIFDGYINTPDAEIFIELRQTQRVFGGMQRDSLYYLLSKIHYYRTIKKVNAYLDLVFLIPPDGNSDAALERLAKEFEPAIRSGLLRIKTIAISEAEYNKIAADATS